MTYEKEAREQEFLARYVTSCATHLTADMSDFLASSWSHRAFVYQESFRGRFLSSLVETVLENACNLFGHETIKEIVARYYYSSTYHEQYFSMVDSLASLPEFVLKNSTGDLANTVSAVLSLCLNRWNLLYGCDPHGLAVQHLENQDDFEILQLVNYTCFTKAPSGVDLFTLWTNSGAESSRNFKKADNQETSVLLAKITTSEIVSIPVEFSVYPLVNFLFHGSNLKDAINQFSPEDEKQIRSMLRILSDLNQCGLFKKVPLRKHA